MVLTQANWAEVTPDSPCPLCGKPDWCSASDNSEAVVCRRTDPIVAPRSWKHIKESSDGYPIYALRGSQGEIKSKGRLKKISKPIACPIPEGEIELATLPNELTHPEKEKVTKSWGYDIVIKYPYSPTQYVKRTEHYDESGNRIKIKKKTKITLPYHQNAEGQWINAKGQQGWPAYRIEEAITYSTNKWVLGVEGETCVEAARSLMLVSNTMQGGCWGEVDLGTWLTQLKNNGVTGLVYWPDNDDDGQRKAQKLLAASGKVKFPVLILKPLEIWADIPETGDIADWVKWGLTQGMTGDEFIKRLELAIHEAVLSRHESPPVEENTPTQQTALPKQNRIASVIAERYLNKFRYNNEANTWMEYQDEAIKGGAWIAVSNLHIQTQIYHILQARNYEFNSSYLNSIEELLRKALYIKEWPKTPNLLPFSDCVLDLYTGKTIEHSPNNYLTWVLPRPYNVPLQSWTEIDNWLTEATRSNAAHKQILLCYAAAVLRRRADLQKFLHLIGTGGSGKSTFMNLLVALVGQQNTISLDFTSLNEKDAVAEAFGKVLAIFPDQDSAGKNISNFKKITGQDLLRGRRLYKDGFNFRFEGMCAVSSNNPIFHSGSGRWLTRRVLMVPFELAVPDGKVRNLEKEFEPELSAFTHYLLSIPETQIEATLKGLNKKQVISKTLWESQIRSDGLASWLNDEIVFEVTARTQIGSNAREWDNLDYDPTTSTLFGSYCHHIKRSGRQPLTKDNFSANLIELLKGTLKRDVEKVKTNQGRFITGVRLRTLHDFEIPCLDELLENFESDDGGDDGCDDGGDDGGDDLKPLPAFLSDGSDDKAINLEAKENLLVETPEDDPPLTVFDDPPSAAEEIPSSTPPSADKNNDDHLEGEVVTATTNQSEQVVEVATGAVTQVVTPFVTEAPSFDEIMRQIKFHRERLRWSKDFFAQILVNKYQKSLHQCFSCDVILLECLSWLLGIEFQPGDRVIHNEDWKGTIQSICPDGKQAFVYLDLMESVHPIDISSLSRLVE
ncbi:DNA primase family protein [Gloeothece verrucosa]|uniref:Primase P4 n=1 Tax=Gloeothece verrucosa (strain PCC 7822) TaxID=497965 RepID=E0UMU9_GLOV7|nr:DUF5906 domain-containing protein [Gloeothece verrucosa]ADN18279.1 primase P4 [Gloeothece verrucosa PCC 7822]